MNVLMDMNFWLDVFLARQPFYADAYATLEAFKAGKFNAYIAASSIPNIFYLGRMLRKRAGISPEEALREAMNDVRYSVNGVQIIWLTEEVMQTALSLAGNDLEDDLQVAAAIVEDWMPS